MTIDQRIRLILDGPADFARGGGGGGAKSARGKAGGKSKKAKGLGQGSAKGGKCCRTKDGKFAPGNNYGSKGGGSGGSLKAGGKAGQRAVSSLVARTRAASAAAGAAKQARTAKAAAAAPARSAAIGRMVAKSKQAAGNKMVAKTEREMAARNAAERGRAVGRMVGKSREASAKKAETAKVVTPKAFGRGTPERAARAAAVREARAGVQKIPKNTPVKERVSTKGGVKTITLTRGAASVRIVPAGDKFDLIAKVRGKDEVWGSGSLKAVKSHARGSLQRVGYVDKDGSLRSIHDPPARAQTRPAQAAAAKGRTAAVGRMVKGSKVAVTRARGAITQKAHVKEMARRKERDAQIKAENQAAREQFQKESAARSALYAERRSRGLGPRPDKDREFDDRRQRILDRARENLGEARESLGKGKPRNLRKDPRGRMTADTAKGRKDLASQIKRSRKAIQKADPKQVARIAEQRARAERRRARQPRLPFERASATKRLAGASKAAAERAGAMAKLPADVRPKTLGKMEVDPAATNTELKNFRKEYPDAKLVDIPITPAIRAKVEGQLKLWRSGHSTDLAKLKSVLSADRLPPPIVQYYGKDRVGIPDGFHRVAGAMLSGRTSIRGYAIGEGAPVSSVAAPARASALGRLASKSKAAAERAGAVMRGPVTAENIAARGRAARKAQKRDVARSAANRPAQPASDRAAVQAARAAMRAKSAAEKAARPATTPAGTVPHRVGTIPRRDAAADVARAAKKADAARKAAGRGTPERAARAAPLKEIRRLQRAVVLAEKYPQRFAGATDWSAIDARSKFLLRNPQVREKAREIKGRVAERRARAEREVKAARRREVRAAERAGEELDFMGQKTGGKYPYARRVAEARKELAARRAAKGGEKKAAEVAARIEGRGKAIGRMVTKSVTTAEDRGLAVQAKALKAKRRERSQVQARAKAESKARIAAMRSGETTTPKAAGRGTPERAARAATLRAARAAPREKWRGREVKEVIVYPYTPDRSGRVRYGFAIGHEGKDFVGGAHVTLSAAVKSAKRFAKKYRVKVTSIRER